MTTTATETEIPLLELFERMALIRAFEQQVAELYRANQIPGFIHTSIGQEAVATGVCSALRATDYVTTTHRGHGHCLAKGADVDAAMAELFGRATGLCNGKGGSMHIADPRLGIIGANAIVGASMPLAVGAALSSRVKGEDRVAVAFFGDGAVNQGVFHEALNLAAIWKLPVLFVCENNGYSEFTASTAMSLRPSVASLGSAYGVTAQAVNGNDVEAIYALTKEAAAACRAGSGPWLIEAITYRWQGHYEGDAQSYKPPGEVESWKAHDPLTIAQARLADRSLAEPYQLDYVVQAARERVQRAIMDARAAEFPAPEEAFTDVYAE